jgi:hypothetical protein
MFRDYVHRAQVFRDAVGAVIGPGEESTVTERSL